MLYNEHYKAAKELDRKIAKLRDEGKDPSLPQKHLPEQQSKASSARSDPARRDSASSHAHNNNTSNRTVPGAFPIPASPMPGSGIGNSGRSMADTLGGTVDESFMLLGGQRVSSNPHLRIRRSSYQSPQANDIFPAHVVRSGRLI